MSDQQEKEGLSGEVPVVRRILDGASPPAIWSEPEAQHPSGNAATGLHIDPAPTLGSSRIADLHRNDVPRVVPAGEPLLGDFRTGNGKPHESRDEGPEHRGSAQPARPTLAAPDPATLVPVPPPPLPVGPPPKRSPVMAILLGLVIVAAAAFAFLWHKASNDKTAAERQVVSQQTSLADANAKAAADLAAEKKAAADAAAAAQQALAAANAKAAADAEAAAAKAQADQAAAVAKATGEAQAAGQATAAALQAKLDAANAAVTAAQTKAATCKSVSDAVTAMIPNLNDLVKLRDAEVTGDTATAQSILASFDLAAFNAQAEALNKAQAACNAA